ncbi:MAG: hypothetical protein RBS39_13625 [Phycisphaerales bacterium]|jgi:hypothetical protein|nr:hypothetical protein [Phycisphaerales bacterium]
MEQDSKERRTESRQRSSDPVWWRVEPKADYRIAWLLERSASGLAFVTRDAVPPRVGMSISLHAWEPPTPEAPGQSGFVRRVQHVHADLYLVAVKLFETRELPSEATSAEALDDAPNHRIEDHMRKREIPAAA